MSEQIAEAATEPGEVNWAESSNDEDRAGFTPQERAKVADAPPQPEPEPHEPPDAALEGDDSDPTPAIDQDDAPVEAAEDDEPPEFWSAEKKALWADIKDARIKAAIKEHVQTASVATAKRMEEAALKVKAAEEASKMALDNQAQAVQWWQQVGPTLERVVQGRWAGVNWNQLAAEDPGRYVQMKAAYEQEMGVLQAVAAKHQADQQQLSARAQRAEQQARAEHHRMLAEKYPKEFGDTKTAEQTYGVLSDYLAKQGIPAERITGIYEAPVVEIIRKAYKYDQLRAKVPGVTNPGSQAAPASTTPKRVVPGPAQRAGNPQNEAYRQAIGRLKSGQRLSDEEGALAFR